MAEPIRNSSSNYYVQSDKQESIYWQGNLQVNPSTESEETAVSYQDVEAKAVRRHAFLNTFDKVVIALVFGVSFVCLCLNLVIQYQTEPIIDATQNYQSHTEEIQLQTKILINEIAEQYDYDIIKQVAEQEGMQLEKSRVRNVGNQ
ncbi:hypothetical protein [Fundicoccus culcitae]|uniref:Cell division protein FtsL n=1 Tax=Fundicoccus culcitae TaxID=2969821 RepID=A0ABY5P5H6_9LACT|nr:hypothetical protein [Fundicoccus culcitae]UUX34001.1 hypothetical protein NRE15_14135 [Fundicoccus culcitae]